MKKGSKSLGLSHEKDGICSEMKSFDQSPVAQSWGAETRNHAPGCLPAISWGLFWGESLAFLYLNRHPSSWKPLFLFRSDSGRNLSRGPRNSGNRQKPTSGLAWLTRALCSLAGGLHPGPAPSEGDRASTCLAPALTLLCPPDLTFWLPKSADLGMTLGSAGLAGDLREVTPSGHLLIHKMGVNSRASVQGDERQFLRRQTQLTILGCHNELLGQLPSPKGPQLLPLLSLLAKSHQQRTEGPEAGTDVLYQDRASSLPRCAAGGGEQSPHDDNNSNS